MHQVNSGLCESPNPNKEIVIHMKPIFLVLAATCILACSPTYTRIFKPAWGHGVCYEINFSQNTYRLGTAMLDIDPQFGTVLIKQDTILIRVNGEKSKEYSCKIGKSTNPFYLNGMQCGTGQYFAEYVDTSSGIPEGSSAKFQDEDVIYLGMKKGKAKSALRVRGKPNLKGVVQTFREFKEGMGHDICRADEYIERDAMREGAAFTVIARTAAKTKVGKAEDHWYFLTTFDGCGREIKGWSFGDFLEITDSQIPEACRFP